MQIALYQPDIPQNTGTLLRLGACLGTSVHIIEPCGFDASDRALKRAGLDYAAHTDIHRHPSFESFDSWRLGAKLRIVLLTTRAKRAYTAFEFTADDLLLLGRESAGVPDEIHSVADARLHIPMVTGMRSINVALAAAMVIGEALRQTDGFQQES